MACRNDFCKPFLFLRKKSYIISMYFIFKYYICYAQNLIINFKINYYEFEVHCPVYQNKNIAQIYFIVNVNI